MENVFVQHPLVIRFERLKRLACEFESARVPGGDHAVHLFLQLIDAEFGPIFDNDLESARRAQSGDGRRREQRELGIRDLVDQYFLHSIRDGERVHVRIAPLIERIKGDEELREVRAIGIERERLAGDAGGVGDAFYRLDDFLNAIDNLLRALQRGRIGELHGNVKTSLILIRNIAGGQLRGYPPRQQEQAAINDQDNAGAAQDDADQAGVPFHNALEDPVETAKEPAEDDMN